MASSRDGGVEEWGGGGGGAERKMGVGTVAMLCLLSHCRARLEQWHVRQQALRDSPEPFEENSLETKESQS